MGKTTCKVIQKVGYRLLAIDPGKANGWAIFTNKDGPEASGAVDKHELYLLLESEALTVIVYESYRLYASHSKQMIGDDFIAPQVIGVIEYLANKREIPFYQQPATCKAFYHDQRLKDMGLYVPIDHRRDAIRHGMYFLNHGKGVKQLKLT